MIYRALTILIIPIIITIIILISRFICRSNSNISRDVAIEIARNRAEKNGWTFDEPLYAFMRKPWFSRSPVYYEIGSSYCPHLGFTSAVFYVNAETGQIVFEAPPQSPLR